MKWFLSLSKRYFKFESQPYRFTCIVSLDKQLTTFVIYRMKQSVWRIMAALSISNFLNGANITLPSYLSFFYFSCLKISCLLQTTNTHSGSLKRRPDERYSGKFLHTVSRGFANSRNHSHAVQNLSNRVNLISGNLNSRVFTTIRETTTYHSIPIIISIDCLRTDREAFKV